MDTLLKPIQVRETLLNKGVRTFTPHDFESIFRVNPTRAKYFLETQTKEGLLSRLKQGVYALKTDLPSEEEIANSLYKPSYISLEYALAYYGIIPEMPYMVTSVTTKPTRIFDAHNLTFSYYKIKEKAYTGYALIGVHKYNSIKNNKLNFTETDFNTKNFFIAEPEKALVDFLYFVSLGKREMNDRIDAKGLSKKKLKEYAKLYDRKKLTELVQEFL